MKHPEAALQRQIAGYLTGHLVPPAYFSAIGHGSRGGGDAGWLRGVIAKQMGVKPDLPDLYFRRPKGILWPTHWIELKIPDRPVPQSQLDMHEFLRSCGDKVAVSRSLDDVKRELTEWGFHLSERKLTTERLIAGFAAAGDGPPAWPDVPLRRRRVIHR